MTELIFQKYYKPILVILKLIRMKFGLYIIVAGILILASCSPSQKRVASITKIDSLTLVLAKNVNIYKNIDTALITSNLKNMDTLLQALNSIDSILVIPEKLAYLELRHSFYLFLDENPQIIEEAATCKIQLDNLKLDAENNLINDEKLQLYFEQESKAVVASITKMELFQQKINSQLINYNLLNSKLANLLDSLSQN